METLTTTIYYTSDTHGYLFQTDYVSQDDKEMGLLNCISNFKNKDRNTLILDGGDVLQGSPLARYYTDMGKSNLINPIARAFNAGEYDYWTPGNHDFDISYDTLLRYSREMKAECLCANIKDLTGGIAFLPHVIRKLANDLKVGLVGIVTDHIKKWKGMEWQNLNIEDPFQAAARELAIIRDKCDITICVYHGGYETDASFSKILETSNENVGYGICRYLSFDILLTAHQHKEKLGENICGTHTLQLPAKAEKYAKIVINYDEETKTKEIISELLSVGNTPASSICQKLQPLEDKVQAWLNEKAGSFTTAPAPVESHFEAALRGSSVVNFFQQVVLEHMRPLHGDTILCCESLRRVLVSFGKEVTIRELLTAYPFLNDLVVLEVDGVILKEALERSAAYYTIDGTLSEDFQPFYYDFIAGLPGNELEYTFDIGEPLGSRVKVLKYREESLLDGNERKLKMCLNDFRASGAGGYDCYGELKPVCSYKDVDLFSLARKYFIDHSPVTLEVKTNLTVENKGVRL